MTCNCAGDRLLQNSDGSISHICRSGPLVDWVRRSYTPDTGPKNPRPPKGAMSGVRGPYVGSLANNKSCDCSAKIAELEAKIADLTAKLSHPRGLKLGETCWRCNQERGFGGCGCDNQ